MAVKRKSVAKKPAGKKRKGHSKKTNFQEESLSDLHPAPNTAEGFKNRALAQASVPMINLVVVEHQLRLKVENVKLKDTLRSQEAETSPTRGRVPALRSPRSRHSGSMAMQLDRQRAACQSLWV